MKLDRDGWFLVLLACTLPLAGNGCSSDSKAGLPNAGSATGGSLGTAGGAGDSGKVGGGSTMGSGGSAGTGGAPSSGGSRSSSGPSTGAGSGGKSGAGGSGTGGVGGSGGGHEPLCPGFVQITDRSVCRTVSDCPSGLAYDACGESVVPPECSTYQWDSPSECSSADVCGPGNTCAYEPVPCHRDPRWFCTAQCTETSCPAGRHCVYGLCEKLPCDAGYTCPSDQKCALLGSPGVGMCVPRPCTEGYTCPAHATCASSGGDEHGCVKLPCSTDGDCPCGPCVGVSATKKGVCLGRLGVCSYGAGGSGGHNGSSEARSSSSYGGYGGYGMGGAGGVGGVRDGGGGDGGSATSGS